MFKCFVLFLDPRKEVEQRGRSVNLALSVRGIESLRAVGAEGPVKYFQLKLPSVECYDVVLMCHNTY